MKIFMQFIMIMCFTQTIICTELERNLYFTIVGIALASMIYGIKLFDKYNN